MAVKLKLVKHGEKTKANRISPVSSKDTSNRILLTFFDNSLDGFDEAIELKGVSGCEYSLRCFLLF